MTELIDDRYLAPVFKVLDRLEIGEVILISDVAPNKPTLWVDCAKQYHKCYGNLLFKDDYSEVKKVLTFQETILV